MRLLTAQHVQPKITRLVGIHATLLSGVLVATGLAAGSDLAPSDTSFPQPMEKQITQGPGGRILTNVGVWSPDGHWIVYDTRPDPAGERFEGDTIEMVNVDTGEVRLLYRSANGAHCGVATFHPRLPKVAFILGPEKPSPDWQYNAFHRQGVIVNTREPGQAIQMDARDIEPPFTPGALRGGSHVHVWESAGEWLSFTYEDHVLSRFREPGSGHDLNQRNVGVSFPGRPVKVTHDHPRNHSGEYFSVLATRTTSQPRPGSDDILKACEEGWVGTNGYVRADGSRQIRALAFQGTVVGSGGQAFPEIFIADLPADLTAPGDGPLQGTLDRAPFPPRGTMQRRLTWTELRKYPGVRGPRHWLRSSPDGSRIAFLMADDEGIIQFYTVSPNGGDPNQLTRNAQPVSSAFTWSSNGRFLAHTFHNSVCVTDVNTGKTTPLTPRFEENEAPRPDACVFSPDSSRIAYVRRVSGSNQIFVIPAATRSERTPP